MQITNRVMTGWLGAILAIGLVAGCNVDATSNTGLRVNVYIDGDSTVGDATGLVDSLRFYIAVQHPDNRQVWVLNEAASGILVNVDERDLTQDPYQLLISEDGDGQMETVKVIVVGERDGPARVEPDLDRIRLPDVGRAHRPGAGAAAAGHTRRHGLRRLHLGRAGRRGL